MDLLKAKIFLDKVNREFGRMSKDPENIARIDVDIMLTYLRDLYDAFLTTTPAPPPNIMPKADNRRTVNPQHSPKEEIPAPTSSEPPAPAPPPPPPAPPPVPKVETPPPPPPPPPVENPAPAPPPPVQPVVPVQPPAASGPNSPEVDALFEFKEAKELSEKLSQTPVNDLKRAISLNDRLLLAKELFSGDQQMFETAIMTLNNFSDYEQAKSYLIDNFVGAYDWTNQQKSETARKLIKLVYRRYK